MKVLLVNGSPHPRGCTYTALSEIAHTLEQEGVKAEMFAIGSKPLSGCIACKRCIEKGECGFDDRVNEFLAMAQNADGFVFGSPVHYAAAGGAIASFMDRAFYADAQGGRGSFRFKAGAAIASARRAGTTATLDQLQKYLLISQMTVVGSQYWNMVHGNTPEEVQQDLEGMQTMRVLARNMAWHLKIKAAGIAAGIPFPNAEPSRARTNFIRL